MASPSGRDTQNGPTGAIGKSRRVTVADRLRQKMAMEETKDREKESPTTMMKEEDDGPSTSAIAAALHSLRLRTSPAELTPGHSSSSNLNSPALPASGFVKVLKRQFTAFTYAGPVERIDQNHLFLSRLEVVGGVPFILQLNSYPVQNYHLPASERLLEARLLCEELFGGADGAKKGLHIEVDYTLSFTGDGNKRKGGRLDRVSQDVVFNASQRSHSNYVLSAFLLDPTRRILHQDAIVTRADIVVKKRWIECDEKDGVKSTDNQGHAGKSSAEKHAAETPDTPGPSGISAQTMKGLISLRVDSFLAVSNNYLPSMPQLPITSPVILLGQRYAFDLELHSNPSQNTYLEHDRRMVELRLSCLYPFECSPECQLQVSYRLWAGKLRNAVLVRDAQLVLNTGKRSHSNFFLAEQILHPLNRAITNDVVTFHADVTVIKVPCDQENGK